MIPDQHQSNTKSEQPKILLHQNDVNYTFSQKHKGKKIVLTSQNLTATNPIHYGWMYFALVEGPVNKKGSFIRFKIQFLGYGGLSVGLALRNVIDASQSQLMNYGENIGHGCYLIGNHGGSNSHTDKNYNNTDSDFKYEQGHIIRIETNFDQLHFFNQSTNKEFKIPIKLSEEQWKQANFCVYLSCYGESVSIV